MAHQIKQTLRWGVCFIFCRIKGENPRGRGRQREAPVEHQAAHGPQAAERAAKEAACKRSAAGGRVPMAQHLLNRR